jgi:hypothetical protein
VTHRGPHPEDATDFTGEAVAVLRDAVADMSWLLGRGYAEVAALKTVGDKCRLSKRQRQAVARSAATDEQVAARQAKRVSPRDRPVDVDAFNVLITLERGLSGGPVLVGRDGALRDLGGVHGTWRQVGETTDALAWIGRALAAEGAGPVRFLIDAPVSNSGRLAALVRAAGEAQGWPWTAEVVPRPDPVLAESAAVVATSDAWILDRCGAWFDLTGTALAMAKPDAWRVTLGQAP